MGIPRDPKLQAAIDALMSSVNYTERKRGVTGKLEADGTLNPDPSVGLIDGYIWVRFHDNQARGATRVRCLTSRANTSAGIPVVCGFNVDTLEYEVLRVDPIDGVYMFGADMVRALNAPSIPANVPSPVSSSDIVPGGLFADTAGGLYVRIGAYWHGGGYWSSSTNEELAPTATASNKSLAVVGIDPATNDYEVTLTADRASTVDFFDSDGAPTSTATDDIQAIIDAAPEIDWRGAVELTNGDTTINPSRIVQIGTWRRPVTPVDAADVTYTPAELTDWDSDTDPGNVDGALDQIATRVKSIEITPTTIAFSDDDVSNPPTEIEIETAFDTAATVGAGFVGLIDDGGAGTDVYLVASTGSKWFVFAGVVAT